MELFEIVDEKEKVLISEIINRYDFKVTKLEKYEDKYKIVTSNKVYLLNSISRGRDRIITSDKVAEELIYNNFNNIYRYVRTKYKELYIRKKKTLYYITEFIEGESCNLSNIDEALGCIKLLANFHKTSKCINMDNLKVKRKMNNWIAIFNKNLNDIEKFKNIIERKRIKNEFDAIYYNNSKHFYNLGLLSINLLNKYDFFSAINRSNKNCILCLDGLSHKNLTKYKDEYYISTLEPLILDFYINDISKYLRSLLNKTSYGWDFTKVQKLLKEYGEINKLTKQNLGILLGLLIFPYKFWKLGKKRYIKHKGWEESNYKTKLLKIIKNEENLESFADSYIKYLENL